MGFFGEALVEQNPDRAGLFLFFLWISDTSLIFAKSPHIVAEYEGINAGAW